VKPSVPHHGFFDLLLAVAFEFSLLQEVFGRQAAQLQAVRDGFSLSIDLQLHVHDGLLEQLALLHLVSVLVVRDVQRGNRLFDVIRPLRPLDFVERTVEVGQFVDVLLDQQRLLRVGFRGPLNQQLQRLDAVQLRLRPLPLHRPDLELLVVQGGFSLGLEDRVEDRALLLEPLLGLDVFAAALLDAEVADEVPSSKGRLLVRDMVPSICWLTECLVCVTEPMVLRMSQMCLSSW
jgi:hypothetical protein